MTNNPVRPVLCGGHPGSPGVMPKDGDEGSTRWLCEGCPDCNPALYGAIPPAEAAIGRVEGLVGALRRTDSALASAPGGPQAERQRVKLDGAAELLIARDLRIVAIDGVSGTWGIGDGGPPWRVLDLRDGMYGDFHRLLPASECFDAECAGSGQHVAAAAPGDAAPPAQEEGRA